MVPRKRDLNAIRVFVSGGVVQGVEGVPSGKHVEVVDYDTDGLNDEHLLERVELDNGDVEGPANVYRLN